MQFLERYKVLAGQRGYNTWLERKGFTIGLDYVSVGFTKNPGTLPPSIHLINRDGAVIDCVYTEDRFTLVEV